MKKTFTIKRSKWLRGNRNGEGAPARSQLCDGDGHKCCLGHIMNQCGFTYSELIGKGTPATTEMDIHKVLDKADKLAYKLNGGLHPSMLTSAAININDDADMAWNTREAKLRKLFADNGITIKFVP